MVSETSFKVIARIKSDFSTKFGVPRQSGLVRTLRSIVVFEPEYRNMDALRGLEDFSHIWLIWGFSEAERNDWSPTVRPPRLGGNVRMGVFATRSPFRPNAIGLSSVQLIAIEEDENYGPILKVSGADLMDGTPIYDIKPYLPSADCHADAVGGFTDRVEKPTLKVSVPQSLIELLPFEKRETLKDVLALDPRPAYHHDPERIYGFGFAGFEVKFSVSDDVLTVVGITSMLQ